MELVHSTHLCPVWDSGGTDPLSGMQSSINPVDGTLATLNIANLQNKHDIMRRVKFYVFHLYQCDIPTLVSPLFAILQLNVTFFRIGSTFNNFLTHIKNLSPLHNVEISSSNLSSNPNVPLDLGTLTKRWLKGHQIYLFFWNKHWSYKKCSLFQILLLLFCTGVSIIFILVQNLGPEVSAFGLPWGLLYLTSNRKHIFLIFWKLK